MFRFIFVVSGHFEQIWLIIRIITLLHVLLYLLFVFLLVLELHLGRFWVQRVRWIGVEEQLGKKNLENVDQLVHWRPSLVDDVEAHRARSKRSKGCNLTYASSMFGW